MGNIKKAIDFMVMIANDNSHGYDQTHRNSPDFDCSSLVATALNVAGFNVSPYSWTGNLEPQLIKCGFVKCSAPFKAGDIHLNYKHHVCMSVTDTQIAQASINEYGKTTGGKTGDQTGREIYIRDYYEYKYGWDVHYRYKDVANDTQITTIARLVVQGKFGNGAERKSRLEKLGYDYKEVQEMVNMLVKYKPVDYRQIARDVILGKYGNGEERKKKLQSLGYDYNSVQHWVNEFMR